MQKVNLIDFTDLLFHAKTLGYEWNQAHDILDNFYPYYGVKNVYLYQIEDNDTDPEDRDPDVEPISEDAKKIMLSFFKKHNVDEFSIKPKSC